MQVEWRFASVMCGALCVIMAGILPMLLWCVVNLDTPGKVRVIIIKAQKYWTFYHLLSQQAL